MKLAGADLLLSPSTGKSPVHSKSHIQRLCFVGDLTDDPESQELIARITGRWPQVDIMYSQTGEEHIADPRLVFYFKDFVGDIFDRLILENDQQRHGVRIVGPLYIRSRLDLPQVDLYNPKIRRPLFGVQMASILVVIASDLRDKKRYARLVQYMGGRVKKGIQDGIRPHSASQKTTVFVGKDLSKDQRTASLLEMLTLRPEWVEYCWDRRTDPKLDILDPALLHKYAMGVFEGLKIFFIGFQQSEIDDMAGNVDSNGGSIVSKVDRASHIVCNPNATVELQCLELTEHQLAVTDHWFWQSINSNRCLTEEDYFLRDFPQLCRSVASHYGRVKSKDSLADCERSKGSDDFSSDDLDTHLLSPTAQTPNTPVTPKSPTGYNKRQQVIMELLDTERNYVNALNLAMTFREMIEENWVKPNGEDVITKSDLQMIFGKIPAIINVHSSILEKVQAHVDSWEKKTNISGHRLLNERQTVQEVAEIWIQESRRLLGCYPPYINNYENGKSAFEAADQKNARFHAFIRSLESNPQFNRNKLTDLLIRPVQRLPSVTLLLKELQKRTTKQEQSKKLGDAVTVLHDVLTHANTVRFKADCKIAHLARFTDMDKVPDHLVCSRRQFIAEMDAVSVIGTGEFQLWPKTDVRILCFNDVIVVCKTREQVTLSTSPNGLMPPRTPTGTLSRLRKQVSMSTLGKTYKKPLKYLKHIPIQFIRDIRELREISDVDGPVWYNPAPQCTPLMVVTIREDSDSDHAWVIHPQSRADMDKLFTYIQQHVQMEFGRSIRQVAPYPLADLLQISEIEETLRKYLRKMMQSQHNATLNYTMTRGGSMLRRAISSASMSVANRITKMTTSRSNLREIMETTPTREHEEIRRAPETPAYDVHPRIDHHSSPDLLDASDCITPKRGFRARFSNLNLTDTLFRRPSMRHRPPISSTFIDENKEN